MENLPDKKAYGCWIDKKGNMTIVMDDCCHAEVALRDILHATKELRKYSTYEIMMRLGFVRVIFLKNGKHTAEYHHKYANLKKQSEWIESAEIVDVW